MIVLEITSKNYNNIETSNEVQLKIRNEFR